MKELGCCQKPIGSKPWFCNPGHLNCPESYHCCEGVCNKECFKDESQKWAKIPAGSFTMGSPEDEKCRENDETQHEVTLTHPFMMATTEVTQRQFESVMGYNPTCFPKSTCGPNCPIGSVTWWEASHFCNKLSELNGLTPCYICEKVKDNIICQEKDEYRDANFYLCPGYRLPTEAEWEYAYRAGTETAFYNGKITAAECWKEDPLANQIAWYFYEGLAESKSDITKVKPHEVGQKKPNTWKLYDMAGNIAEWVQDWYRDYLSFFNTTNPHVSSPPDSGKKVYRGGSNYKGVGEIRASSREKLYSYKKYCSVGFRCVKSIL